MLRAGPSRDRLLGRWPTRAAVGGSTARHGMPRHAAPYPAPERARDGERETMGQCTQRRLFVCVVGGVGLHMPRCRLKGGVQWVGADQGRGRGGAGGRGGCGSMGGREGRLPKKKANVRRVACLKSRPNNSLSGTWSCWLTTVRKPATQNSITISTSATVWSGVPPEPSSEPMAPQPTATGATPRSSMHPGSLPYYRALPRPSLRGC